MLVAGPCICSRLGAALLNVAASRSVTPETLHHRHRTSDDLRVRCPKVVEESWFRSQDRGTSGAKYPALAFGYVASDDPVASERSNLHDVEVSLLQGSGAGISQRNRVLLEELHRHAHGSFDVTAASRILGIDHDEAGQLLVYLARRGWLSRVRRGLYVTVPLDARRSGEWMEDPWVVADRLFSPCYVGGWSAFEHWDLTEQVFRTILVVTARRVRHRDQTIQGIPFHLTVRDPAALFGTVSVWRGQNKVAVSDPSRTVVDALDDPRLGGGIRTVADVVHEYLRSEHRDDDRLIKYGDRLGNRAIFKRLGYVLEHASEDAPRLIEACLARRSSGLAKLDPSAQKGDRILRRWGLRVNVALGQPGGEW
jgi:predicted transcriptional regulator of viral defense system